MQKFFSQLIISTMLLLSFASLNFAATPFTKEPAFEIEEVSYTGAEMASFLLLQDAKAKKEEIVSSLSRWPEQKARLIYNLTNDRPAIEIYYLFGVFLLMIVAGLITEKLLSYRMNIKCNKLIENKNNSWFDNLNALLIRGLFQFVGLGIFVLVGYIIAASVYEADDIFRVLCWQGLGLIIKIRVLDIFLRLVLAPFRPDLRLLKTTTSTTRLYYSLLFLISFIFFVSTIWKIVTPASLELPMFALLYPISGLILNIASISFVWFNRKNFTLMFQTESPSRTNFSRFFAQIWPSFITLWLLFMWVVWASNEFLGNHEQAVQATKAWWLTFTFPILDRIAFLILSQLKQVSWLQSRSYEKRCDIFISRVIIAIRIILLSAILYLMDSSFGYNAWEMLATNFAGFLTKSVDVLVIIILAYAVWEIIQSAIERHLPYDISEDQDDGFASLEGEGGGSGASRSETLLPLVRSFLLVFLVVSVVLTILNVLGVEIAPLLAGAGIVGIAVGFGAQKLVQDVISGIFFLLDDAFRRGEYIEAADLRGTVERISIRSIRLRHHLGAVQTIPFGEIATVRNLSRDWITMKLEFRLDYRTDVEKVRKLIKKVGQKMLEHPEYGKHFLLPLKSQGVIRVEESALIFRMKFTSVPGEQWVIRREAFTHVKNALKENGIEFAHRSVHVLMSGDETAKSDEQPQNKEKISLDKENAAGAAALTATPQIQRNEKIDFDFDNGDGP